MMNSRSAAKRGWSADCPRPFTARRSAGFGGIPARSTERQRGDPLAIFLREFDRLGLYRYILARFRFPLAKALRDQAVPFGSDSMALSFDAAAAFSSARSFRTSAMFSKRAVNTVRITRPP